MLNPAAQRGFTLIEALVALGLMLAGIAGATVLLLATVQYERESANRRAAIRLAATLAEELRARRAADGAPLPPDAPAIAGWYDAVAAALPAGATARVEAVEASPVTYRVELDWPVAGAGRHRFALAVTP